MNAHFIGIDLGTQGLRVGVIDENGLIVASCEKSYETFYPSIGWAEQIPNEWLSQLKIALHVCLDNLDKKVKLSIQACSVCATSSTVLPVDKYGKALGNAIMWMDNRAINETEYINKSSHPILEYCGNEVAAEWLIPKVLWYKNNQKDKYETCFKIIEQLDWINYYISGEFKSSLCNATCKGNYVDGLGFDKSFFESIGIPEYENKIITEVVRVGDVIGKVTNEFAKEFGLDNNLLLVQGGIDAHIATYGLGVIEPGNLALTMGTSFVHLCLSKERAIVSGIWGPYLNPLIKDYWLLEGGQISAGSLVKWFMRTFGIEEENPYKVMANEASLIEPGAEGLVVLDFFQGNRTPYKDPNAKGVIYGLNLKHTRGHIYRAIIESVSYGTRNIIENFEKQGCEINKVTASGGVTLDTFWMQVLADITGKTITVNKDSQAGVLGCCVIAAVGASFYDNYGTAVEHMVKTDFEYIPNTENNDIYLESYTKYLEIYQKLKEL
jgi:FGGY-family pentulose kinase